MKWFHNRTISFRILLLLVLILIPINALFIVSAMLSALTYQEEVMQANKSVLNVYAARLQAQTDQADAFFASQIITGEDLLSGKSSVEKEVVCMQIYYRMQEELSDYEFASAMFVFDITEDRMYLSYDDALTSDEYSVVRQAVREQYESESIYGWQVVSWEENAYLIRCYRINDLCFGIVIPVANVVDPIVSDFGYEDMIIFLSETNSVRAAESGNLLAVSDALSAGLVLIMEVSKNEINSSIPLLQKSLLAASVLMVAIIPILYFAIRRIVIRPLTDLDTAMHRIEDGDLDYRMESRGYAAEFVHINHSLNEMLNEITQLRSEKYEYELERQKHEMISLQLQIKPHFLYNTFNDVSNMAQVGDYGGIRELMGYLVEYFRYTIRTGYELVPLQRELNFLEVYYSIMEIRHPGCFAYEIEVDPQAEEIRILPLLIHTFVENTMSHAVKEGNFITSRIMIRPEEDRIRIYITDDGEGMPEQILRQIEQRKKLRDEFGKDHVGIWNCYKRLELYYRGDADITITSVEMQGVSVVIDMPWEKDGGEKETEGNGIEAADGG